MLQNAIYSIMFLYAILGHKILHCVFREKFLELAVQLSSKGLVVRYYQSGLVQGSDDIGHGECLAGACDS